MDDEEIEKEVMNIIEGITNAINGSPVECAIIALCEMIVSIHENSEPELQQYIAGVAEGMQTMINPKPAILLN